LFEIEAIERGAEVLPLAQDGQPGKARLEPFQADFFKQAMIVGDVLAPLLIVIGDVERIVGNPETARLHVSLSAHASLVPQIGGRCQSRAAIFADTATASAVRPRETTRLDCKSPCCTYFESQLHIDQPIDDQFSV
jgi:hypothetical protein